MKDKMLKTLEFDKIREMLSEHALSDKVKEDLLRLEPYMDEAKVIVELNKTTQAKKIMETMGSPPLASVTNLMKVISLIEKDAMLMPENLVCVSQFISACRRMKSYLKNAEGTSQDIAVYGASIDGLSYLDEAISGSIRNNEVYDKASNALYALRRKILKTSEEIKAKIDSILRSNTSYLSENFVSYRNGHYALPVKKQYKGRIAGTVIDISNSNGTYFIEPQAVERLQQKLAILEIEEDNEVRKILYELTALVEDHLTQIKINIEAMELLDFVFAKAKLSLEMDANPASISSGKEISIKQGRHPLIEKDVAVPLDFDIGGDTLGIIITGPNTGGKTVAIKTVGLMSTMTQCGLHVPAEEAKFCLHNIVLCDIGDGQSITENLSTFSSHMTNIIDILRVADGDSLVLLDELGSGTDPTEGMGLATSILEELADKGCLLVATTHYPQIKDLARHTQGFSNARMTFDRENLMPLYKLEIGEAGESCALYIAQRLGLPKKMLQRAHEAAYSADNIATQAADIDFDAMDDKEYADEGRHVKKYYINRKKDDDRKVKEVIGKFTVGDCVMVLPGKETGVVFKPADSRGEVGVQIKKVKSYYNHKRVKLVVAAEELYPEDYDMAIIFDSVENRKARKIMGKRHDPNVKIVTEKEGGQ
jgi:dsDNA-specific endonuclease/ATPase MutS2